MWWVWPFSFFSGSHFPHCCVKVTKVVCTSCPIFGSVCYMSWCYCFVQQSKHVFNFFLLHVRWFFWSTGTLRFKKKKKKGYGILKICFPALFPCLCVCLVIWFYKPVWQQGCYRCKYSLNCPYLAKSIFEKSIFLSI